ncbi:hypothetical protein J4Q44_G00081890 [Coregonus suidteri]|uniref:Uncharacterized protein n=1 Tax=Coregonus suidteri TaxID=861788 RepID=A0AAN8R2X6_9TELE
MNPNVEAFKTDRRRRLVPLQLNSMCPAAIKSAGLGRSVLYLRLKVQIWSQLSCAAGGIGEPPGQLPSTSCRLHKSSTARDLFKVTYSIPGSNRRWLENDTICHWFNWLAEEQDGECPPLTVAMVLGV